MPVERVQRRLAAVLAADVVGYSRLMEADEEGTRARLRSLQSELIVPRVVADNGRIVKTSGDGVLVEFGSAVDAVHNALDIQAVMRRRNVDVVEESRIIFRVGINVGDIIVEDDDIHGDGVNIAARLEALCEPGEVLISGTVHDQVEGKLRVEFDDLGERPVKNITKPVRVFRAKQASENAQPGQRVARRATWEKPAVAVLPFVNMSEDPEQEYFADGVSEDIITALSRLHWLFVIARTSSFEFKGQNLDVRKIARRLDVRYVLEGSVRKAARRLRITGQLIDAESGAHLWADRFDGEVADIFDLQDKITESVVGAIEPKLLSAEIERSKRERPDNVDAYDLYLRSLPHFYASTQEGSNAALELLNKALELDSTFASAAALAAWCYFNRVTHAWSSSPKEEREKGARLARKAIAADPDDPNALANAGWVLATLARDLDGGVFAIDRAVELSPNNAYVMSLSGWVRTFIGDQESAFSRCKSALRLSPSDPLAYRFLTGAASSRLLMGEYHEAAELGIGARRIYSKWGPTFRTLAAAHAQLGNQSKAIEALSGLLELEPSVTVSHYRNRLPYQVAEQSERLWEGLRKAGLPE